MSYHPRDHRAEWAAQKIRDLLLIQRDNIPKTAVILGTGWAEALSYDREIEFSEIIECHDIPSREGHPRTLALAEIAGKPVLIQRGRFHQYEHDPELFPNADRFVRLQVEMLSALGVKRLILTCAAGGLGRAKTGEIVIVDGFCTLYAPPPPLYGIELIEPGTALKTELWRIAQKACKIAGLKTYQGGYVMVRGPAYEDRRYDKFIMARAAEGIEAVGMSVYPETAVASLFEMDVLALCAISNNETEEMDDKVHRDLVGKMAPQLRALIEGIIAALPD